MITGYGAKLFRGEELIGPLSHFNCRCSIDYPVKATIPTEINELGCKLAAKVLLLDKNGRLIVPSQDEWIGVNLLERDDDLPNRSKA